MEKKKTKEERWTKQKKKNKNKRRIRRQNTRSQLARNTSWALHDLVLTTDWIRHLWTWNREDVTCVIASRNPASTQVLLFVANLNNYWSRQVEVFSHKENINTDVYREVTNSGGDLFKRRPTLTREFVIFHSTSRTSSISTVIWLQGRFYSPQRPDQLWSLLHGYHGSSPASNGAEAKLTTHYHTVSLPWLRIRETIPPLLHTSAWLHHHGQLYFISLIFLLFLLFFHLLYFTIPLLMFHYSPSYSGPSYSFPPLFSLHLFYREMIQDLF